MMITGVQVGSSVFILGVFSQNSLVEHESEEVFIVPAWSFEENSDVDVDQFVISHTEDGWSEVWLFGIFDFKSSW